MFKHWFYSHWFYSHCSYQYYFVVVTITYFLIVFLQLRNQCSEIIIRVIFVHIYDLMHFMKTMRQDFKHLLCDMMSKNIYIIDILLLISGPIISFYYVGQHSSLIYLKKQFYLFCAWEIIPWKQAVFSCSVKH